MHRGQAKKRSLEETSALRPWSCWSSSLQNGEETHFCCWRLRPAVHCHSSLRGLTYKGWLLRPLHAAAAISPLRILGSGLHWPEASASTALLWPRGSFSWTQHWDQPCSQPAGSRLLPTSNSVARRSPVCLEETWGCLPWCEAVGRDCP